MGAMLPKGYHHLPLLPFSPKIKRLIIFLMQDLFGGSYLILL
jgi:hypothetical protein